MMTKEVYEIPQQEVIEFSEEDAIKTSGSGGGIVLPDDEW